MGKSFNDDVFNNGFNLDTINGLNISKEAIEENKEVSGKDKRKRKVFDLAILFCTAWWNKVKKLKNLWKCFGFR